MALFLCEKKMSKKLLAYALVAYIGTKSVLATPMTRAEYCDYRGWEIPESEDPEEQVYLVEYTDGGKANDERHSGYITMSPKEVFNNAYRQNGSLTFGDAIVALKQGQRVARSGWNGKGMFLYYVPENKYPVARNTLNTLDGLFEDNLVPYNAYFAIKNVNNTVSTWVPSINDCLAEDWVVL